MSFFQYSAFPGRGEFIHPDAHGSEMERAWFVQLLNDATRDLLTSNNVKICPTLREIEDESGLSATTYQVIENAADTSVVMVSIPELMKALAPLVQACAEGDSIIENEMALRQVIVHELLAKACHVVKMIREGRLLTNQYGDVEWNGVTWTVETIEVMSTFDLPWSQEASREGMKVMVQYGLVSDVEVGMQIAREQYHAQK
jgi:hypothetical protein